MIKLKFEGPLGSKVGVSVIPSVKMENQPSRSGAWVVSSLAQVKSRKESCQGKLRVLPRRRQKVIRRKKQRKEHRKSDAREINNI